MPDKVSIKLIIFLYCAIVFGSQAKAEDHYVYDNVFNPSRIISIDVLERRIIVGDVGRSSIEVCDGETFFCFSDQYFTFAVPVQGIGMLNEWEYNGVRFINYGAKTMSFLDTVIDVYIIHANTNEIHYRYLYSEKNGLVAIGILDPKTQIGETFLIRGQYGFPH